MIHCAVRAARNSSTTRRRRASWQSSVVRLRQRLCRRLRQRLLWWQRLWFQGHRWFCHNEMGLSKATVRGVVFFEFHFSHGRVAFFLWQGRKADWQRSSTGSQFARGSASVSTGLYRWPCCHEKAATTTAASGNGAITTPPICRFALLAFCIDFLH